MDQDSRVTIEYLRRLPRGAVVHWASDHVSSEREWTTHWVDVRITDEGSPPMEWTWTIIGEDDRDGTGPEQLWQFVVPYDLDVHQVWDPVDGPVNVWVAQRGRPPPDCIATAYAPLAARLGGRYERLGGWSVHAIERALAGWVTIHADRRDVSFVRDAGAGPSRTMQRVLERAREGAEGAGWWDLGGGLRVASGLMDELLAMEPRERGEVLAELRAAHARFRDREQTDGG